MRYRVTHHSITITTNIENGAGVQDDDTCNNDYNRGWKGWEDNE
jgi:hypothetical protein